MKAYLYLIVCVALAAVISLIGIGNNDFWDDEANTARIGQNFLKTGQAVAWDGHNLLSHGMDGSIDRKMRKTVPPLQYLLAGVSLKIFGNTTAGGRMLFLIIGLLTIPLAALWYKEETKSDAFWVMGLILALSVPYLLYIRQVRYYAPGLCFTFGFLWSWARLTRADRLFAWAIVTCLFLIMLILTNYIHAAAALAVACLGFLRKAYHRKNNYLLLGMFTLIGAAALTGAFFYGPELLKQAFSPEAGAVFRWPKIRQLIAGAPMELLRFEFFPAGMLLFSIPGFWRLRRQAGPYLKHIIMILVYCTGIVFAVAVFSPQPDSEYNLGMRYAIAVIPLAAAAATVIFEMLRAARLRKTAWVFVFVLLSSNLLTFNVANSLGLHSRIYQYLHENLVDYTTGSEAISEYIAANIPEDSCLFMIPLHTNIIQMFYHPQHTFCGLVSKSAPFVEENRDRLRKTLFFENVIPDYFIIMRLQEEESRRLLDLLYGNETYALKDVLYVYGENLTRPEIPWRSFGPKEKKRPDEYQVFVFERTNAPAHPPRMSARVFESYITF